MSPPVSSSGLRQTGNVLDKIQAELAETKRREDELRRQRRSVARSQPDLSNLDTREAEAEARETEEFESGEEVSIVCTQYTCILANCTHVHCSGGGGDPQPGLHPGQVRPHLSLGEQDPVREGGLSQDRGDHS